MWTAIAAIASALVGGLATLFGTKKTNQTSEDISNKNIAFQQQENDITRLREDNAQQRAAADLQAAGLSKTLAAGNPASAAALTAPQDTRQYENPMQKAMEKMNLKQTIMDLRSLKADVDYKEEQKKLIQAQAKQLELSNSVFMDQFTKEQAVKDINIEVAKAQIRSYDAQTKLNEKIGEYKTQEILSDIYYKLSQVDLNNVNISKIEQEVLNMVKQGNKLDKETEMLVQDIINAGIKERQMQHDLDYAIEYNLPVGQQAGGLFGGALSTGRSLGVNVRNKLSQWSDYFKKKMGTTNFTFVPENQVVTNPWTGEQKIVSSFPSSGFSVW